MHEVGTLLREVCAAEFGLTRMMDPKLLKAIIAEQWNMLRRAWRGEVDRVSDNTANVFGGYKIKVPNGSYTDAQRYGSG
jgi:hypothetical protein